MQYFLAVLGQWSPIPCTYAGGGKGEKQLNLIPCVSVILFCPKKTEVLQQKS